MNLSSLLTSIGIAEPVLQGAFVQGILILLGLLLAAILVGLFLGARRRREAKDQRETSRRQAFAYQLALRAEVRAQWAELDRLGALDVLAQNLVEQIDAARWVPPGFTPIIVRQPPTFMTQLSGSDFAALAPEVIGPAVEYYRQLAATGQLTEDLGKSRFDSLPADRKIELVRTCFGMLGALKAKAVTLNGALETALRVKPRDRATGMRIEKTAAPRSIRLASSEPEAQAGEPPARKAAQ